MICRAVVVGGWNLQFSHLSCDCGVCFLVGDQLNDMMLSPNGVRVDGGDVRINVCPVCWGSLKRKTTPKCAIVNNFAIGRLPPEFDDTSWLELALVCATRPVRCGPFVVAVRVC